MHPFRGLVNVVNKSMASIFAVGAAALGVLAAGGYSIYRLFNGSRNGSTQTGQAGYQDKDAERKPLIKSASISSESEVDFEASSAEDEPKSEVVSLEQLTFKEEEAERESQLKHNLKVSTPFLPNAKNHQLNAIDEVESASNRQLLSCSGQVGVVGAQFEPEEQLVAVGCTENSQQPAILDIDTISRTTLVESKPGMLNARKLPNESPAAEHSIIFLPSATNNSSHSFSAHSPPATKPKPKSPRKTQTHNKGQVAMTPAAIATSPKKNPNSVLVMPKGLAEHIALRSPGGVRNAGNRGEITQESPPNAKRLKLNPPGAIRIMPMDTSAFVLKRRGDGGQLGARVLETVLTNRLVSDEEEEKAVSFDEPVQAPKLMMPSRNKGPNRRPPTTHRS